MALSHTRAFSLPEAIPATLFGFFGACFLVLSICLADLTLAEEAGPRTKADSLLVESIGYSRENDVDKAIGAAKASIDADATYTAAHVQLGYLLIEKNALDEAMHQFDKALELSPNSHQAKTGKGIIYSRKGDFKAAESILRQALLLNPEPVRTHFELGVIYETQGELDKALAEFKEGIRKFQQGRK
jgi:tetratricopeptide (TPR) repeat protein